MRKCFAAAVGRVAALVGFAGAANASATIDLIWADTGTNGITFLETAPTTITLQVVLTAGPAGSQGAGVTVDFSTAAGKIAFLGAANNATSAALPIILASPINVGSRVEQIGLGSFPPFVGTGLTADQSEVLGTVTWHKGALAIGTFEIRADTAGATDGILDFGGADISSTTTFNSAFLVNVPEPGALSMLVMALGGMVLAGRGRRS